MSDPSAAILEEIKPDGSEGSARGVTVTVPHRSRAPTVRSSAPSARSGRSARSARSVHSQSGSEGEQGVPLSPTDSAEYSEEGFTDEDEDWVDDRRGLGRSESASSASNRHIAAPPERQHAYRPRQHHHPVRLVRSAGVPRGAPQPPSPESLISEEYGMDARMHGYYRQPSQQYAYARSNYTSGGYAPQYVSPGGQQLVPFQQNAGYGYQGYSQGGGAPGYYGQPQMPHHAPSPYEMMAPAGPAPGYFPYHQHYAVPHPPPPVFQYQYTPAPQPRPAPASESGGSGKSSSGKKEKEKEAKEAAKEAAAAAVVAAQKSDLEELKQLYLEEKKVREAREKAAKEAMEQAALEKKHAEEIKAAAEKAAAEATTEAEKKAAARAEEEAKKAADDAALAALAALPPEEKKKPIKFKDAVGRKFNFPFDLCATWSGMEELIRQAFMNIDVIGVEVDKGHYDLIGPNNEIILPKVWETVIEPDWTITMHMWPMPEPEKPPEASAEEKPKDAKKGKDKGKKPAAKKKKKEVVVVEASSSKDEEVPPPPPPAPLAPPGVVAVESSDKKKKKSSGFTLFGGKPKAKPAAKKK